MKYLHWGFAVLFWFVFLIFFLLMYFFIIYNLSTSTRKLRFLGWMLEGVCWQKGWWNTGLC